MGGEAVLRHRLLKVSQQLRLRGMRPLPAVILEGILVERGGDVDRAPRIAILAPRPAYAVGSLEDLERLDPGLHELDAGPDAAGARADDGHPRGARLPAGCLQGHAVPLWSRREPAADRRVESAFRLNI